MKFKDSSSSNNSNHKVNLFEDECQKAIVLSIVKSKVISGSL